MSEGDDTGIDGRRAAIHAGMLDPGELTVDRSNDGQYLLLYAGQKLLAIYGAMGADPEYVEFADGGRVAVLFGGCGKAILKVGTGRAAIRRLLCGLTKGGSSVWSPTRPRDHASSLTQSVWRTAEAPLTARHQSRAPLACREVHHRYFHTLRKAAFDLSLV